MLTHTSKKKKKRNDDNNWGVRVIQKGMEEPILFIPFFSFFRYV